MPRFLASWSRTVQRDVRVLGHVFPWRSALILGGFVLVMAAGVQRAYNFQGGTHESLSFVQAIYAVGMMLQLQYDLPAPPQLDPYLVLVPAVGLPLMLIFGLELFQVLRIFFVREERGQLWQGAWVATLPNLMVVCGLGRGGFRVAQQLHRLHLSYPQCLPPVVGIDLAPSPLTERLMREGVPVLYGDIRSEETLHQAGVTRASAVIVCTNQDMVNIDATLRIHELNPHARVVLRLFDDALAPVAQKAFGVERVISRSARAAAWFVESALGHGVLETFALSAGPWQLQRFSLAAGAAWIGQTPTTLEAAWPGLRVLVHTYPGMRIEALGQPVPLQVGDDVYVLGPAATLNRILQPTAAPYVVGGLGHTGYRVALYLRERGLPVIAIDERGSTMEAALQEAGVRVIRGDFRQPAVLERARIREAAAIILCAEKDMYNVEAGVRARELNPHVRVVMRLFEEELGERLARIFAFNDVHSTSAIAAPDFVAATLPGLPSFHPVIGLSGWYLMRVTVPASEVGRELRACLARRSGRVLVHIIGDERVQVAPPLTTPLRRGDTLLVLVPSAHLLDWVDLECRPSGR